MKRSGDASNEEDVVPLVKAQSSPPPPPSSRTKCLVPSLVGTVMVAVGLFFLLAYRAVEESNPFHVLLKNCKAVCSTQKEQRIKKFGGDLLDMKELVKVLVAARDKQIQSFKVDYGDEYFSAIFEEKKNVIRKAMIPANESSTQLLKRKLQLKILKAQSALHERQKSSSVGCDCNAAPKPPKGGSPTTVTGSSGDRQRQRRLQNDTATLDSLGSTFAKFIWTTGGHSAAAGHGNLHNESYTAFLERAAKDVFASVGIEFIGKNFGMGGFLSAPELALCSEAIFGSDTDAVSWDYGMTDGGTPPWLFRMFYYNSRVSLIPSRPALFGVHVDSGDPFSIYSYFGGNGVPSFIFSPEIDQMMRKSVPDSFGLSAAQLNALPPFVRNFKCEGQLEVGEPYCDVEKYSAPCPDRSGKASWHPGWKFQALTGNAMGLFLIETLVEAAEDLASMSGSTSQLLDELQALDDADRKRFLSSALPESLFWFFDDGFMHNSGERGPEIDDSIYNEINRSLIFRGHSVCHTALLPAESRYLGYVTDGEKNGFWTVDAKTATSREEVDKDTQREKDKSPMRVTFETSEREKCSELVKVDFKDFFYASVADGWTTMTIPTDSEAKAYRYDSGKVEGVIITCFGCVLWHDYGCNEGDLLAKDIHEGKASLEINGEPVTSMVMFHRCHALKNKDGFKFKPNSEGRFTLRARVNAEKSYLRFTSVTVL